MKKEIEKILAQYSDGEETLQEATTKVLRLFSASGSPPLNEQEIDNAFKQWNLKNAHLNDTDSWSFKNGALWAEERLR